MVNPTIEPTIDYSENGKLIVLEKGFRPETIHYSVLAELDGKVYMTYERERNIAIKRRRRKTEAYVSAHLDKVPWVLADPDKVIVDPDYPDSARIYYRMFELETGERIGLAVPICTKEPKYVYTVHDWKGKTVKGEARGLTITWLKRR